MAATSNHPGDVAMWIEKVIDSCQTSGHENTAWKLIDNFQKKYYDYSQIKKLRIRLDEKIFERLENRLNSIKSANLNLTNLKNKHKYEY